MGEARSSALAVNDGTEAGREVARSMSASLFIRVIVVTRKGSEEKGISWMTLLRRSDGRLACEI